MLLEECEYFKCFLLTTRIKLFKSIINHCQKYDGYDKYTHYEQMFLLETNISFFKKRQFLIQQQTKQSRRALFLPSSHTNCDINLVWKKMVYLYPQLYPTNFMVYDLNDIISSKFNFKAQHVRGI